MAATQIKGPNVGDGTIYRDDLNVATAGQAVIRRILEVANTGIKINASTGADTGTGDVSLSLDLTYCDNRWQAKGSYAPESGSGNYIQNQSAAAQTANMWISGSITGGSGSFTGYSDFIRQNQTIRINPNYGLNDTEASIGILQDKNLNFTINVTGTPIQALILAKTTGAATFASSVQATTGKFTNLTDGYLPYHVSDASGLSNSPIFTDETNVTIGSTSLGYRFKVYDTSVTYYLALDPGNGALLGNGNVVFSAGASSSINYTINNVSVAAAKMRVTATGGLVFGNSFMGTDPGAENVIIAGRVSIGTMEMGRLLDVVKSTNSGSDVTIPTIRVRNSLVTQGNDVTTYNIGILSAEAGNGAVRVDLGASYSSGAIGSVGRLLTQTNHALVLGVNGTEQMRISTNGNVSFMSLTASKLVFTDVSKNLTSTAPGTSSQFWKGDGSLDSTVYVSGTPWTGAGYIALSSLSSTATGLTYTNTTGVFSLMTGYTIPTTTNASDWSAKQAALSGTGFVKISGTTISYDNSTYVTGTPWTAVGYWYTGTGNHPTTIAGYGITDGGLSAHSINYHSDVSVGGATQNQAIIMNGAGTWVAGTPWTGMGYVTGTPWTALNYITLASISSTATGLTYTNTTGVFSLTAGYAIPTSTNISTWNALTTFPGFGTSHSAAAYGDHTHSGMGDVTGPGSSTSTGIAIYSSTTGKAIASTGVTIDSNYNEISAAALYLNGSGAHGATLYVTGDGSFSSTVSASNFILNSDRRRKTDIRDYKPVFLNVSYKDFFHKNDLSKRRFGVIYDELKLIAPDLVSTDVQGYGQVSYIDLLIREVAYLKDQVAQLNLKLSAA